MSPRLTTFLFESINFLVLAGILGRIFFKPVRAAIAKRAKQIADRLAEADNKIAEVDHARAELAERGRRLEAETDQRRQEIEHAAHEQAATIVQQATAKSEEQRKLLAAQLAAMRDAEVHQLARSASRAAALAAGRLLEHIQGPELQQALERAACAELGSLDGTPLTRLTIESAGPLSEAARQQVLSIARIGADRADFRIVTDLGPGVRLVTDRGLIDSTVAGISKFVEQALVAELESTP